MNKNHIKAYILTLGLMSSDVNFVVMGETMATVSNPNATHRITCTPSYAVLINHPKVGWILFDTGMPDEPEKIWP